MRAMKDSGISWIGQIPEQWKVMPNKWIMSKVKDIKDEYENEPILSLTTKGVVVRNLDAGGKMPLSFDGYQIVSPNNLLMCLFDIDVTPCCVGLIKHSGLTSPAYSQFVLHSGDNPRYFEYLLKNIDSDKSYLHLSKNLRSSLTETDFGAIPTCVPPVNEQQRIADFLDTKCAEIDEMIAIQEKTVEELKAYKQSIITEAVTKGLNPDAPMKDSGIPWIGLIPQGWNTIRLKQLCNIKTGSQDTINRVDDGQYPFFVRSPKVERINSYCYDGEAILMAGDGVGAGRVFHHYIGKFDCHQRVYYLHEFRGINTRYLYHFLSYNFYKLIDAGSAKSTVDSVRLPMLTNFVITIPSKKEQREIVSYIDKKGQEIDSLIEIKQQKAEELKTYKKSLIYEYVTGKKEVV